MNKFQEKETTNHKFISISKLDSKGRILIPKKLRDKFTSKIFFILLNEEKIEIKPVKNNRPTTEGSLSTRGDVQ